MHHLDRALVELLRFDPVAAAVASEDAGADAALAEQRDMVGGVVDHLKELIAASLLQPQPQPQLQLQRKTISNEWGMVCLGSFVFTFATRAAGPCGA